jgi:hypothetical protein
MASAISGNIIGTFLIIATIRANIAKINPTNGIMLNRNAIIVTIQANGDALLVLVE